MEATKEDQGWPEPCAGHQPFNCWVMGRGRAGGGKSTRVAGESGGGAWKTEAVATY